MQIARIVEAMKNNNTRNSTAMVILDVEKAYDTIWRHGLIHKLLNQEIPSHTKTHIKKLEVIERNTLRIILNKSTREISNEELYHEYQNRALKDIILQHTRCLFQHKILEDSFARNIGAVNRGNAAFRKILRLIIDAII